MTEDTPEKVAELIAEAREWARKSAFVGRNVIRDLDRGIAIARRLADALEAVAAERDEALAVIGAIRLLLPKPMSEPLSRDFTGRPFPRTIDGDQVARVLSRIPEHPKED